jgi:Ras-related protein Rab-8A
METIDLIVIGSSGVGKSSLARRFVDHEYEDFRRPTIGSDFYKGTIEHNGSEVKFRIWDTSGQERFLALTQSQYRPAKGVLLVFDTSESKTLVDIFTIWSNEIIKNCIKDNIPIVMVGNKSDLESDMNDLTIGAAVAELQKKLNIVTYFHTSAKENINVENAFTSLIRNIVDGGVISIQISPVMNQINNVTIHVVNSKIEKSNCSC